MEHFDVIVIGTGVAGQTAAAALAEAGRRVAIVDKREYGGTCALRGCEAKKTLFAAAEAVERVQAQNGRGVEGRASVDWPALIAFKRTFTDTVPASTARWLADAGVDELHATARFVSADTIDVTGADGSDRYSAGHFVVATGARPMPLGIPGSEFVIDSEQFMAAERLGGRIVFVGGGYVSFEFAHIAASAGADVTILHRGEHVLRGFDSDLADMLVGAYRERGIDLRTRAPVTEVRRSDRGLSVALADGSLVECDEVVHGAGRVADLEDLALDAAGVTHGRRGVEVDEHMRSVSNPRVFAAGDAAARGVPLTPVGVAQGRIAARNIIEPGSATFAPAVVPSVAFSDPPLASAGLGEKEASEAGLDADVRLTDSSGWASSRRVGVSVSGAKTIVERRSGRVLGAHLLGHHADEVINALAIAMTCGMTAEDLKTFCWAYPTAGWDITYLL